jgi:hypothetical protein
MEDSKIDSGKEKLSATIPYYLKKRMEIEVENNRFSTISEVATVAIAYFFGHYDQRLEDEKNKRISQ